MAFNIGTGIFLYSAVFLLNYYIINEIHIMNLIFVIIVV